MVAIVGTSIAREDFRVKEKIRIYLIFGNLIAAGLLVIVLLWKPIVGSPAPPPISMTSQEAAFQQALTDYVALLDQEKLFFVDSFRVGNSESFIFLTNPLNTHEITTKDITQAEQLISHTAGILENRIGIEDGDITISFVRPKELHIILLRRSDMPPLLSADTYGEFTLSWGQEAISLVNFSGPLKAGRRDLADAWYLIQAVCLGYTSSDPYADQKCNVFSANAAAGWVGMDPFQAAEIIHGFRKINLDDQSDEYIPYVFMDFVYNDFLN
jgi:hypothetical protein